jgi:hypothetical protein
MNRSATNELPRQGLGDAADERASGNARMPDPGMRIYPALPRSRGAATVAGSVSGNDSQCADAPRRTPRTDLSFGSRAMRTAANVCPFFRNAGTIDLRSARQATPHPGRKLPDHAPGHRRLKF